MNGRYIPESVKQEVRKACGFGCVICGFPLFEYDHIKDYSKTKRHDPLNIALLCALHHDEKTRKLLRAEDVLKARFDPYNIKEGRSSANMLRFSGQHCTVKLGNNEFKFSAKQGRTVFRPLIIDGFAPMCFELVEGDLLLSMTARDETGNDLLQIRRNRLRVSTQAWDYNRQGKRLTLKSSDKSILLDLEFEHPDTLVVRRARFLHAGVEFAVLHNCTVLLNNGSIFAENTVVNFASGIVVGDPVPGGCAVHIPDVPRESFDRREALRNVRRRLKDAPRAHYQEEIDGFAIQEQIPQFVLRRQG